MHPIPIFDAVTNSAFKVTVAAGNNTTVRSAIDRNQPVVVFVTTGDLSYWPDNTSNAIVAVGYNDEHLFLNDPLFADAPQISGWKELMLAWREQDYTLALVED